MTPTANMLLGALISDAACLGTHWIYEPARISEIAARHNGSAAFVPVDAANYEGVKAAFVHGARDTGMLTQYGETLRLAIQSINAHGDFDATNYTAAFAAHFGAGGTYNGYIDRPTKGTLANIAAETTPSGIDDDQTPAVSRLPAIMARYRAAPDLAARSTSAMQITNVNDIAANYTAVFADVLARVMRDEPLKNALEAAANGADDMVKVDLLAALSSAEDSSTDFAGITGMMGRACHLPSAAPVIFHILNRCDSFTEAVERNILVGGDSAGRAIMIGAIMGRVHGVSGQGVPLEWALALHDGAQIWDECQQLGHA